MDHSSIQTAADEGDLDLRPNVTVDGVDPILPSRFPIGQIAAIALAGLGSAAADLAESAGGSPGNVSTSAVDGARLTIGFATQRMDGVAVPRTNQSNPFVHCYEAEDERWVYLHGGFPGLRQGLADLLGVDADATFPQVQAAVSTWNAIDLEDAIADRGLCGAMVRSHDEWLSHPQGSAVESLPRVLVGEGDEALRWQPDKARPLAGLRVLDLTRVLAGPTCGKYLAVLGAEVTNIRSAHVPVVPSFVLETGVGKEVITADLRDAVDRHAVRELAAKADVIVQGYRPGIVGRFGLDAESLRADGWHGVYANINCYGPIGPWAHRAGWEQLAQSVSGMAHHEGAPKGRPQQVPAALNDYVTGVLMATAITRQLVSGTEAELFGSLCQTAAWVMTSTADHDPAEATGIGTPRLQSRQIDEGIHEHLGPGFAVDGLTIGWDGSATDDTITLPD